MTRQAALAKARRALARKRRAERLQDSSAPIKKQPKSEMVARKPETGQLTLQLAAELGAAGFKPKSVAKSVGKIQNMLAQGFKRAS